MASIISTEQERSRFSCIVFAAGDLFDFRSDFAKPGWEPSRGERVQSAVAARKKRISDLALYRCIRVHILHREIDSVGLGDWQSSSSFQRHGYTL